ncbi:MAG: C25 family cysteine peptidase, partial [Bacteroidota bacterium]
ENLKGMLENSSFGADVVPFSKSTSDLETYRSVPSFIDAGSTMMTFYGHSTLSSLDFDVGKPEDYSNVGRYPFFYAIGCNTNKLYEGLITLSEDWVLIEDKGAIGFFGSTWLTGLANLGDYADIFYRNIGTDMYGATVGQITVETTKEYTASGTFTDQQLAQVYTLHGDPAIRLYPFTAPDYLVSEGESQVNPDLVDVTADSITLNLNVTNIGKNISGMLDIQFEHKHPNGTIVPISTSQIQAPTYDTALVVRLALEDIKSLKGENFIQVTLDPNNTFVEAPNGAEANNVTLIPFYIVESAINAVYPENFAIVSQQGVTLKSSTTNPFAAATDFIIEIDTTKNFDSPLMVQEVVNQMGGVLQWTPSFTLVDNTTYYWRVSPNTNETYGRGYYWDTHSFTFIENSDKGWIQQDFYQFQEDELEDIQLNNTSRELEFDPIFSDVRLITGTFPNIPNADIGILTNGFRLYSYFFPCANSTESIWIAVFDPNTLKVREQEPPVTNFNYCGADEYLLVANLKTASERDRVIDFLLNEVRPRDYVAIFTTKNRNNSYNAGSWAADSTRNNGHNIFNLLEAQGATQIRDMEDSETPYIFVYQKDNPSFAPSEQKAVGEETIDLITVLEGRKDEGTLTTPLIGPANSWGSFEWSISDTTSSDVTSVDIYGIDQNDQEVLIIDDFMGNVAVLDTIDAIVYPYLRLEYFTSDNVEVSPGQIDYLKVLSNNNAESNSGSVAELALAANIKYHFHKEILGKGDQVQLKLAITNLSNETANNLETNIQITDNNAVNLSFLDTISSISPQGVDTLDFIFDSDVLAGGDYELFVNTNSDNSILEGSYENNSGTIDFMLDECLADVFVATDYERGIPIVRVSNTITSDRFVESEANVTFTAGTSVTLLPGFHAKPGSDFHALIGGCSLSEISNLPEEGVDELEARSDVLELETEEEQSSFDMDLQVSPNPASSMTNISFNLPESGKVKVTLMDLNGKVLTQTYNADTKKGWNQTSLDVGNLRSGMYLIVLQNGQSTVVKKLMINK